MSNPVPDACPHYRGMPALGLGTWKNDDPETCAESIRTALELGYRHVDTAQIYGNETAVGNGIASASVPREDIFLTTKVWTDSLAREDVLASTRESLDRLGVESVDLLYVHWPAKAYDPSETLPAFESLREQGLIEHIGVSNFEPETIDRAREVLETPIFANQVECHPLLQQDELRRYCDSHDIELVAYSPLARGAVFENPTLNEIAADRGISEAQVSLAWLREKGLTAIPKATSREHLIDNWASLEVELSESEVDRIDAIENTDRQVNPRFAPWNQA